MGDPPSDGQGLGGLAGAGADAREPGVEVRASISFGGDEDDELISEEEIAGLKTWVLQPMEEVLWARIEELLSLIIWIEEVAPEPEVLALTWTCRRRLRKAKACLMPRRLFTENESMYWRLIHQVKADLLLVMPLEMAIESGLKLQQDFVRNVEDRALVNLWIGDGASGRLPLALARMRRFQEQQTTPGAKTLSTEPAAIRGDRHALRTAVQLLSDRLDDANRQLAVNTLMMAWSSGLLAVLVGALLALVKWHDVLTHLPRADGQWMALRLVAVGVLGAIGGHVANMISKSGFLFANGAVRRFFVYHLVAKPLLSAVAAGIVYLMTLSRLFFAISALPAGPPNEGAPDGSHIAGDALITFHVGSGTAGFAYAALAIAAGVAGELLVRMAVGRLLAQLRQQGDSTQASGATAPAESALSTAVLRQRTNPS